MKPLQLYSILAVGFPFASKGKLYVFYITVKKRDSKYNRTNVLRKTREEK